MAKLSTARDFHIYGHQTTRKSSELINAGIYIFAAVFLLAGFLIQLSPEGIDGGPGYVAIIFGLFLMAMASADDLVAHLVGIDYSITLIEYDPQLAFVEISVPLWLILGDALTAVAFVLFLNQRGRENYDWGLEKHAANLLIAGPVFWLLGSVQNLSQVYERSTGLLQILQKGVQIPFLMGSLLFLVGGIFNKYEIYGHIRKYHSFNLMGKSCVWLSLFGSLLFLIGGLMNAIKVLEMHLMDRGRLERLRGGALERLGSERAGRVPLILEGNSQRRQYAEDTMPTFTASAPTQTPAFVATLRAYRDVLVSGGGGV